MDRRLLLHALVIIPRRPLLGLQDSLLDVTGALVAAVGLEVTGLEYRTKRTSGAR